MARLREAPQSEETDEAPPSWLLTYVEGDWLPLVGSTPDGWPDDLRPWPTIRAESLWSAARRSWLISHGVAHGDWHKFRALPARAD